MEKRWKQLVEQHVEDFSSDIFEEFPEIIGDYTEGKHGIYALYNGDELYYVGLTTDLKSRLTTHQNDRHKKRWDRFSLFLTKNDKHLKDLETLYLHIYKPKGNEHVGQFIASSNLKKELKKKMKEAYNLKLKNMIGMKKALFKPRQKKAKLKSVNNRKKDRRKAALAPYIVNSLTMRRDYKGKRYTAKVHANGEIHFNGKLFTSASTAGAEIMGGHSVNGWTFWKYQNESGEWVLLDELRKKRSRPRLAKAEKKQRETALASYVKKDFNIQAKYKGKIYTAKVNSNGTITYNGKLYTSPSGVGSAIRGGKATDGWKFWKYQNDKGDWVKLDELRK